MFNHDISRGMATPFALGSNDSYESALVLTFSLMGPFMAGFVNGMENGVHAVIPSQRTIAARLLDPKMKNRNRIHFSQGARQAARVDPKATAFFLDENGFITEVGGSKFRIVKGKQIISPEPRNILRVVSREAVREFAPALGLEFVERNIEPCDVHTVDDAFFTSTPSCVMPCVKIDGRPIGDSKPGPITGQLLGAFSEEIGMDILEQALRLAAPYIEKPPEGAQPY